MPVTATPPPVTANTNKDDEEAREEKKMNSYTNTEAVVNECDAQET